MAGAFCCSTAVLILKIFMSENIVQTGTKRTAAHEGRQTSASQKGGKIAQK